MARIALWGSLAAVAILHAASTGQELVIELTAVLMSVLLMGLLHRQREGIGGTGWESALILVLFVAGYAILATLCGAAPGAAETSQDPPRLVSGPSAPRRFPPLLRPSPKP